MHSTSPTAADSNSDNLSSGWPHTPHHGALTRNAAASPAGPSVFLKPQNASLAGGGAGAAGNGGIGAHEEQGQVLQKRTAKPPHAAPTAAALNPFAQEFQPGAPSSNVANQPWAQKGLLPAPTRGRKETVVNARTPGVEARSQQMALGPAGRRGDVQGGPAKSGGRAANATTSNAPPRVTGWEVQSTRPLSAPSGGTGRAPASTGPGGLSSALQIRVGAVAVPEQPAQPRGEASAAAGAAQARRGQAVNANFLLNFKYEEHRRQPPARHPPPPRRRERLKPYNKELFLQANFRFLVSDLSDYSAAVRDPDRMLDWEDVAAVEVLAPAALQCPICLEQPPCCPQITLCGHIFCFPCLLRYLTQGEALAVDYKGDGPWKKCPLCFTLIAIKDLRTVSIRSVPQYNPGDRIRFTLLTRAKGSIIPFERPEADRPINPSPTALCYSDGGECALFAKFTLTSSIEGVTRTATQALTALADRTAEGLLEDPDALPFIYGAMDHLQARAQAWADHRSAAFVASSPPVRQRILAQNGAGEQKLLGKSPRDLAKALAGTAASDAGLGKGASETAAEGPAAATGWGELNPGNSEMKQRGAWVYEDAFSDAGSEESGEARSVEGRKESALKTIEEGLAGRKGAQASDDDGSATESGSDQEGVLSGFAPDGTRRRKKRLAKVPEGSGRGAGAAAVNKDGEGEEERAWYCFYQSADGQPVFLHPLSMKCLLAHYGRYEALPLALEAGLVEAEAGTMASESTRKKYRYLSHLSLTAAFTLAEVDLRPLLPASAFAPFLDEITARERRRARAEKQEREQAARQARQQAVAAAQANERSRPPAPEDFAALLSAMEEADLEAALAASSGGAPQGASPPAASPAPSVPIAFSAVTKMGYASAYDAPALHPAAPAGQAGPSGSTPPRWGPPASPTGAPVSFAAKVQAEKGKEVAQEPSVQQSGEGPTSGKKNKKGPKMLLSTGSARRY